MRRVILKTGEQFSNKHLKRTGAFNAQAMAAATSIIEQVREQGDAALRELTEKFDGVKIDDFRVPARGHRGCGDAGGAPKTEAALQKAAKQTGEFHERQVKQSWFSVREDGALVGAKVTPLESVGIYVPGGRALYPSTVLMNALPTVAGVERIVCVTPPTKDGSIDPVVLEACRLAGVTEIYTVGGAQAVAALAYGTESIEPVCKITGPGNAFVAAAPKIVSGDVGIDIMPPARPRCASWPMKTANPAMVAIDLMAQAEHDPLASCYLVTFDEEYADKVEAAVEQHMKSSTGAEDDHGIAG
ncbi:MAG: histidinol dehydrogenase [Senegalimassilia faecalis]